MKTAISTFKVGKIALYFSITAIAFTACKKDIQEQSALSATSDEVSAQVKMNGLLVSAADTTPGINNLYEYTQTGENSFSVKTYNSSAKDGNGVFFNSATKELYQVSRAKKTIYVFANENYTTPVRTIVDNTLTSGREITYDSRRDILYVANNSDSTIRVYKNFSALSGEVKSKTLKIGGQPWGLVYNVKLNQLVVVIDLAAMRLDIFDQPARLPAGPVMPSRSLAVNDRPNGTFSRLHGIAYDELNDILYVTEIGEALQPATPTPGKPAFNADGGIYMFKKAAAKLASGGSFTADNLIYGSNTGLGNPVDVVTALVDGKNKIFVAEKANKMLLDFTQSQTGNVAPLYKATVTYLPEAITLKTGY